MVCCGTGTRFALYAADLRSGGVHVFDGAWNRVNLAAGAFRDPGIPAAFGAYNVWAFNHFIIVTYAERNAGSGTWRSSQR